MDRTRPRLRTLELRCHRSRSGKKSTAITGSRQRSSKKDVDCPHFLECVVYKDDPTFVYVYQHNEHRGHSMGGMDDVGFLALSESVHAELTRLLSILKPRQALLHLQRQAILDRGSYSDRDFMTIISLSTNRVERLRKELLQDARVDANEVRGVDILHSVLEANCLLYRPQLLTEDNTSIKQHLEFAFMLPFQAEMLRRHGKYMVFMDAVYNTNAAGYPVYTLLVKDEFGRGCPVAYCVSSTENSDIWARFITAAFARVGLHPSEAAFMMDKSRVNIAAVSRLGGRILLCHFHMLQDWERFLRSPENGLSGRRFKRNRTSVMMMLRELQRAKSPRMFETSSARFKDYLSSQGAIRVLSHYQDHWEGMAERWAGFGRLDIHDNTNNIVEASFRLVKYTYCNGSILSRIDELVQLLAGKVAMDYCLSWFRHRHKLQTSHSCRRDGMYQTELQRFQDSLKEAPPCADSCGRVVICSSMQSGTLYHACIGDGSCECSDSDADVCMHVEVVSRSAPLTSSVALNTATYLCANDLIVPDTAGVPDEMKMFTAFPVCSSAFEDSRRSDTCFYVDYTNKTCTCHVFSKHATCCHLLAAAMKLNDQDWLQESSDADDSCVLELKRTRRSRLDAETSDDIMADTQIYLEDITRMMAVSRSECNIVCHDDAEEIRNHCGTRSTWRPGT